MTCPPRPKGEPIVIPNGARLTWHWTTFGKRMATTMGLVVAPGTVIDQSVAGYFATLTFGSWTAGNAGRNVANVTSIVSVGIRDLRTANQPEWVASVSGAVGASTTEPLPPATAMVVTLRTAKAGRSFRGRLFLPFNANEAWDGTTGHYTAQAGTDAAGWITNWRQSIPNGTGIAGKFQLAVLSSCYGSEQANVVVSNEVRNTIQGSQRGRNPHRG